MYSDNILLIGMSGAGKSTLGVLLAKAAGKGFIDTDLAIQQHEKRFLQSIIDSDGVGRFMEIEEDVLSAIRAENCVIATGGSAVYSEKAMSLLKQGARCVYLHVPFDEIMRRIKTPAGRGIVIRQGSTLRDAYDERQPLYEKYSDLTVKCSGKTIEDCVAEIMKRL